MNDFENRLKASQVRRVPGAWRQEILAAARKCSLDESRDGSLRGSQGGLRHALAQGEAPAQGATPWWLAWLWPSPVAWAAVACAWLLIFGLDYASRPARSETAGLAAISPGAIEQALIQQQQIVQELFRAEREPVVPTRRRESGACNGLVTEPRTKYV